MNDCKRCGHPSDLHEGIGCCYIDSEGPCLCDKSTEENMSTKENDMLQALEYAQELIKVARKYFPKSIQNSDTFKLENTCAVVGKAIHNARGE